MNWASRKVIFSILSKYAVNLREEDIDVSIFTQHHVKLKNLELNTTTLSSETAMVSLAECRLANVELVFDLGKLSQEPINVKISDAILILRMNEDVKSKKEETNPVNDRLREYLSLLRSKSPMKPQGSGLFTAEMTSLKEWLANLLARKINISIHKVDVAVEYGEASNKRYFGLSFQNIELKSKVHISEDRTQQLEEKCFLFQNIGLFTGFRRQVNFVSKKTQNREVWEQNHQIAKVYFLKDLYVSVSVTWEAKSISVLIENFLLNCSPLFLKEVTDLVRFLSPFMNPSRPRMRPNEGPIVAIGPKVKMKEGALKWWKYVSFKVLGLVSQRRKYNILLNNSFRVYFFCLIYQEVYNDRKNESMNKYIREFELKKSPLEILKIYQLAYEKISQIRENNEELHPQNRGFIEFISNHSSSKKYQKQLIDVKKQLRFADVVKSSSTLNLENGRAFIRKLEMESFFRFNIKVQFTAMHVFMTNNNLIDEFKRLNSQERQLKTEFGYLKDHNTVLQQMCTNFLNNAMTEIQCKDTSKADYIKEWNVEYFRKLENCYGEVVISSILVELKTNELITVEVDSIKIIDHSPLCYYREFLDLKGFRFKKIEASKLLSEYRFHPEKQSMSIEVDCCNAVLLKPFFEKINFIFRMSTIDIASFGKSEEIYEPTMREILYSRLLPSSHFKNHKKTQTSIILKKINILVPLDYSIQNDILAIKILGVKIDMLSTLDHISVKNTKILFTNTFSWLHEDNTFKRKILEGGLQGAQRIKESVIVSLGRMTIGKYTPGGEEKLNNKRKGFVARNTQALLNSLETLDLVIPLIVIRISLKQLFSLNYLVSLWSFTGPSTDTLLHRHKVIRHRSDHDDLSANQRNLGDHLIKRMTINVKGVILSVLSIKRPGDNPNIKSQQNLFEVFVNDISLMEHGFVFKNSMTLVVKEVYLKNITNHLPINIQVMQSFLNSMLSKSDLLRNRKQTFNHPEAGQRSNSSTNPQYDNFNKPRNQAEEFIKLLEDQVESISEIEPIEEKNVEIKFDLGLDEQEVILDSLNFRDAEKNDLEGKLVIFTEQKEFLRMEVEDNMLAGKGVHSFTNKINLSPLNVILEMVFFTNLLMIADCCSTYSRKRKEAFLKFIQLEGYVPVVESNTKQVRVYEDMPEEEQMLLNDEDIIMDTKQTNVNKLSVTVKRVNILIYHKQAICYCVSVADCNMTREQFALYDTTNVNIDEFYLIDTHPNSGPWQNIFALSRSGVAMRTPKKQNQPNENFMGDFSRKRPEDNNQMGSLPGRLSVQLKKYKNKNLCEKYKCGSYMRINIENSQVVFLKKKVKQLVNCMLFIMGSFVPKPAPQDNSPLGPETGSNLPKAQQNQSNAFLYWVQLNNTQLAIPQNSLSQQHFHVVIERIVISNHTKDINKNEVHQTHFQSPKPPEEQAVSSQSDLTGSDQFVEVFQECSKLNEEEAVFQSFKLDADEQTALTGIYVIVREVQIPNPLKKNPLLRIPSMCIQIDTKKQVKVDIDIDTEANPVSVSLSDDQFTCLIRMTEENVSEVPLVFEDKPGVPNENIGMVATVVIARVDLNMFGQEYNHMMHLERLFVKMVMYNNNSKDMDVTIMALDIQNMEDQTVFVSLGTTSRRSAEHEQDQIEEPQAQLINVAPRRDKVTLSSALQGSDKVEYVKKMYNIYSIKPWNEQSLVGEGKLDKKEEDTVFVDKEQKNYVKLFNYVKNLVCCCCPQGNHKKHTGSFDSALRLVEVVHPSPQQLPESVGSELNKTILIDNNHSRENGSSNEFIETEKQMIHLAYSKDNPATAQRVAQRKYRHHSFKMAMHGCANNEKTIHMLITNMEVAIKDAKETLHLTYFFSKPYLSANPDIKQHMRFNNFAPMSTSIKVDDAKIIVGKPLSKRHVEQKFIEIVCDLNLLIEFEGDTRKGPGFSRMDISSAALMKFVREHSWRRIDEVLISNQIQLRIDQNTRIPRCAHKDVEFKLMKEIVLTGEDQEVLIKLPVNHLKYILQVVETVRPKPQPAQQLQPKADRPEEQLKVLLQLITDSISVLVPRLRLQLMRGKEKFLVEVEVLNIYMELIRIKESDNENSRMRVYATVLGKYMNMRNAALESMIEPWKCELKMKQLLKNQKLFKTIQIGSAASISDKVNSLNINFSTSLIAILKEAQTRYFGACAQETDGMVDLTGFGAVASQELKAEKENELLKRYNYRRQLYEAYFGKKFIKIDIKKPQNTRTFWNINLRQWVVFHSFFDGKKGKKITHIRSPYRIQNMISRQVMITLRSLKVKGEEQYKNSVLRGFSFAIPLGVYKSDYLVSFSIDEETSASFSVLHLMSEYLQKSSFYEVTNSPFTERFASITIEEPKRFMKETDFVFQIGKSTKKTILGVCVKSEGKMGKPEEVGDSKSKAVTRDAEERPSDKDAQITYDTSVVLIPPLIIKNELPITVEFFVNGERVPVNPSEQRSVIELDKSLLGSMSLEVCLYRNNPHVKLFDREEMIEKEQTIDDAYTVRVQKLSQYSRLITLYTAFILKNQTYQNFTLKYRNQVRLLESYSWEFLANSQVVNDKETATLDIYRSGVKARKFSFNKSVQILRIKKEVSEEGSHNNYTDEIDADDEVQLTNRRCFQRKRLIKTNKKYQIFEIVIKIVNNPPDLSRTMLFFYRYDLFNDTKQELTIFHHNTQLFKLQPHQYRHLVYYESNSQLFRIGYYSNDKLFFSQLFRIDAVRQFTAKIKKETHELKAKLYPHERNNLFRISIVESKDILFIKISEDTDIDNFPMYLENATAYPVRIQESDEDFVVPPGKKIPFFWSNLDFEKSNVIDVEIQGKAKRFVMNQRSDFDPINISDNSATPPVVRNTFKRGVALIAYKQHHGEYLVVCDVLMQELKIYSLPNHRLVESIDMNKATFTNSDANKVYVYLFGNISFSLTVQSTIELMSWIDIINNCLSLKAPHRIMFTVQSDKKARVIKLQEMKGDRLETVRRSEIEVYVRSINVALITSSPNELILANVTGVRYLQNEEIKKAAGDNLIFVFFERTIRVNKIKINNQMGDTVNPVLLAQIKRSQFPYLEFKANKKFYVNINNNEASDLTKINVDESLNKINHFVFVTLFLDQTEVMVDSFMVMEIFKVKNQIDKINDVYRINRPDPLTSQKPLATTEITDLQAMRNDVDKLQSQQQIYINFMNIEPVKFAISINWNLNQKEKFKGETLQILRLLPFGIQNATIELKSFASYHIFEKKSVLVDRLFRYYTEGFTFQILRNAGSYDLLAPLRIISGVGSGAKNIFYDPIYTFYKEKEIQATAGKCLQGLLTFITFLFWFIFRMIQIIVKGLASLTFDRAYIQRRNSFHKQTIKGPKAGFVHGAKYYWSVIEEVFRGFIKKPVKSVKRFNVLGVIIGPIHAVLGLIKIVIGPYDWLWAIGSGILNFGNYEPNAMNVRTRPIRIFRNGVIKDYDYNQSLAHEIMQKNGIEMLENQEIQWSEEFQKHNKQVYFLISNYRFIYATENLSHTVLQLFKIRTVYADEFGTITVRLEIPETVSYYLFSINKTEYSFPIQNCKVAQRVVAKLLGVVNKSRHTVVRELKSQESLKVVTL